MLAPLDAPLIGDSLQDVLERDALTLKSGTLEACLFALATASSELGRRLRSAALSQSLGRAHHRNVFGDDVQKLDTQANSLYCAALSRSGACAAVASEELQSPMFFEGRPGGCSVVLDPLDGSSNLDTGLSVGSIFGIFDNIRWLTLEHAFLRKGRELSVAGYIVYGPRTTLVVASRSKVMGFDLDNSGAYRVTAPALVCPTFGAVYSVNEANQADFFSSTRTWLGRRRAAAPNGQPASLRYSGALVADAHRTLLRGGVFAYPGGRTKPEGKLRYLYEVNPISFVFEAAGGGSSTGAGSPLDRIPKSLEQRCPLVVGSRSDVDEYERCLRASLRPS